MDDNTVPPSGYMPRTDIAASREVQYRYPDTKYASPKTDVVNHPAHYTAGGIETIDFIEAKELGYHLASVIKYVSRAGKKDPGLYVEDLRKAAWYIERAIQVALKAAGNTTHT